MKFTLEIELGNSTSVTPAQISRVIAESINGPSRIYEDRPLKMGDLADIHNDIGQTVGKWEVVE